MKYIKELNIDFNNWDEINDDYNNIKNYILSNKSSYFFIKENIKKFCKLLLNIINENFNNKEIKVNACRTLMKVFYNLKNVNIIVIIDNKFIFIYYTIDNPKNLKQPYYDFNQKKIIKRKWNILKN